MDLSGVRFKVHPKLFPGVVFSLALGWALVGACGIDTTNDLSSSSASSGPSSSGSGGTNTTTGSSATQGPGGQSGNAGGAGGITQETPATIACGSDTCAVPTEACCSDGTPHCIAATAPCGDGTSLQAFAVMFCDDSTDCGPHETCCVTGIEGGFEYRCASDCSGWESCVLGYESCSAGLCVPDPVATGTLAKCDPQATIPCGAAGCDGLTPVCCVTPVGASCSAAADCQASAFTCSSPLTCPAGQVCCAGDTGSECVSSCGAKLVLCATLADCPVNDAGLDATACDGNPALPGGMKACVY